MLRLDVFVTLQVGDRPGCEGHGKDESGLMKGKVFWRLVISFASAVNNSQPSRSANAT
jgi:hypothetical protein